MTYTGQSSPIGSFRFRFSGPLFGFPVAVLDSDSGSGSRSANGTSDSLPLAFRYASLARAGTSYAP